MLGTLKAVEKQLLKNGLLLRNLPASIQAEQGAFLARSFWLVEIYTMLGRIAEATKLFERLLSVANDVGLLSEEYDTQSERLIGNFPQGLCPHRTRACGCPTRRLPQRPRSKHGNRHTFRAWRVVVTPPDE